MHVHNNTSIIVQLPAILYLHRLHFHQEISQVSIRQKFKNDHDLLAETHLLNIINEAIQVFTHWLSNCYHSHELDDIGVPELPTDGCFL